MRPKQKTLGGSFLKFSRNLNSAFLDFFRKRDSYGQQIALNYKGQDSFNTCPGGFLSLILSLFIFSYMIIQFTAMHHHKDWSITQQIMVADPQNIEKLQEFRQMKNISIAVQIQQKREKEVDELELYLQKIKAENEMFLTNSGRRLQEKQDNYTMLANNASQYLIVMGMYENKKGNTYEPYDRKINPNSTTWKRYETEVRKNNFGLTEVNLNLSDAVMKGTDDSNNYMDQVTTRLQLRFNSKLAQINSYKSCASDQFLSEDKVTCSSQLMSFEQAANTYLDWMASSPQYTKFGASDQNLWPYSQSDIEHLLQTQNEDEINLFMYKFYHDIVVIQLGLTTWEMRATYAIIEEALYKWKEAYDTNNWDLEGLNAEVSRLSKIIDETAISDSDLTSKVNEVIDEQMLVGGTIQTAISEYVTESLEGGEIAVGIEKAIDESLDGGAIYTRIEDAIDESLDGGAIYTGIEDYVDTYHSRRRLDVNRRTCSTYLNELITSYSYQYTEEWPSDMIQCLQNEIEALGQSQKQIRKMLENERQFQNLDKMAKNFLKNHNLFINDLNDQVFSKLEFEIVIYDEIETFKDSDYKKNNVTYEYPFGMRKNKIDSITFNTLNDVEDYIYKSQSLKFQRSTVCLDPPFYHDIQTLVPKMLGFFTQNILGRDEEEQEDEIDCDGKMYSKIKYSKDHQSTKTILQDYSKGMIKDKILLEIKLLQDQFETFTERRSTQLFDYFGDIGGVYGIIEVVVAIMSSFFSTKLLQGDIANTYFSRKKLKKEMTNEKIGGIDDIQKMFAQIRISTFQIFIDPLFAMLSPFDRCKSCSCRRRLSLIDKSQDILSSELDVFSLLNKLGETYNMLKHFQFKQQKTIQKYSKDRAIKLTETGESSESSSSDSQHEIITQFKEALKTSVLKNIQVNKKDRKAILDAENKIKEELQASILKRVQISNFLDVNTEVHPFDPNRLDSLALVPSVDVSQEQLVNRDINFYQDNTANNNNTSLNFEIQAVSDKGRRKLQKSKKKKKV